MRILGLETSCDETAAAVVKDGRWVQSNLIASQIDLHRQYGGIVPEVASRQHVLTVVPIVRAALEQAGAAWADLDGIAVTHGPGLAGSLLVGVNLAKALAQATGLPLAPVNHLQAHVYANWLVDSPEPDPTAPSAPAFPLLCLVVSGGHTELVLMHDHLQFTLLGKTRDDAAGEAFDKAARVLGLGYPGGPAIDRAARTAGPRQLRLPRARVSGRYDFSFSGLKTAVLREVEARSGPEAAPLPVAEIAAEFQEAVVDALVARTAQAAREFTVREVLLSGGVAANSRLRQRMREKLDLPLRVPPPIFCTDNAAMVAAVGHVLLQRGVRAGLDLDVYPNLPLVEAA